MNAFWNTRTGREKLLLGVSALLTILLLVSLLMVRPALVARTEAGNNLAVATRTLDAVTASVSASSPGIAGQSGSASAEMLRTGLVDLAARGGLAVSRLQAGDQGQVVVQFDAASPALIFAWLDRVEQQYGAKPFEATLSGESGGMVRASFEFRGGAV